MATVLRGALYSRRPEPSPLHRVAAFVAPNLITTVFAVAVVGLPVPLESGERGHVYPQRPLRLGLDTSRSSFPGLLARVTLPKNVAPHLAPQRPLRLGLNTSWSSPSTLIGRATTPIGKATLGGIARRLPLNLDTSKGSPQFYQAGPPVGEATLAGFARRLPLNPDTSQGRAPAFLQVADQPPVGEASGGGISRRLPLNADTSQGRSPVFLQPAVIDSEPRVYFVAGNFRPLRLGDDTSQSTPLTLLGTPAAMPAGETAQAGIQRQLAPNVNTSRGTPLPLYGTPAAMPAGKTTPVYAQAFIYRINFDTSRGFLPITPTPPPPGEVTRQFPSWAVGARGITTKGQHPGGSYVDNPDAQVESPE